MSGLVRQLGRIFCAVGSHGRLRVVRRISDAVAELECERCGRRVVRPNAVE